MDMYNNNYAGHRVWHIILPNVVHFALLLNASFTSPALSHSQHVLSQLLPVLSDTCLVIGIMSGYGSLFCLIMHVFV